ncbi:WD40 repeat-like protein [Coccomyxa subellipsoidea C-169]|uniref:WD40 repeat-like protein n=1 Tax=Coccomyxa subellipsoidea (strain C-169) TaxID=574566 RepID=I0YL89_COCSC|nr:WD40 repeat-like protein [Coccomyxa subellipsoidea C-169]EIE19158.1 WD40 repeat-like protein [Coccomyxa subellipsoidea C-169]|eukprot:XP_005643702.1 WD40 repeat-like protein [Coccomyxa subellipsoidea C-169]
MGTPLTSGEEDIRKDPQASPKSLQEPQNGRSGDKEGGMPEGAEISGQTEEGSASQTERLARDSLDDSVVVKDLDTGRAINVLKKYTIRDLNTGQLFVVDAEPATASEAASEPGSPKTAPNKLVTDVSSGREMSMEEFDRALGLHTALEPVKVQAHSKLVKELTHLCVIQELNAHNGVIWTMKFSKNGKYLASAGQDAAVRVWEVCLNRGETENAEEGPRVLRVAPYRTFAGHTADVLDLAWSKSQFLLTASMDKTVRLWHISMDDCLRVFKHTDFVTSLDFHPVDDKYFISGSIDGKVRVWNIPEQRVVDWADVHEMVTATAFAPDGRRAVVGTMKGRCRFYQCEPSFKLEYQAQIDVKNRRGNTSRGRKITGMQFMPKDPSQLLITSNDSRVRLYDGEPPAAWCRRAGFTLRTKYKGHHNRNTQIRGTFSSDGAFLICGSDDGWVYVWTTGADEDKAACSGPDKYCVAVTQEKSASYECFHAHNDIVTVALFAPKTARRVHRIPSQRALGQVILTAGYNGEIKVFENLGAPHWLHCS